MRRCTLLGIAMLCALIAPVVLAGPVRAAGDRAGTRSVAASPYSTYAIERDGSLWTWGDVFPARLGSGATRNYRLPHRIGTGTSWAALAVGHDHCLALKRDGSLWAWGDNNRCQLGLGPSAGRPQPKPVRVGASLWRSISAGFWFSVAVRRDGSLWSWGSTAGGELGNGSDGTLRRRVGTDADWRTATTGSGYVLALKTGGSLWGWGANQLGQLGIGAADQLSHPVTRVGGDSDWTAIAAGGSFNLALKTDGSLWAWGDNHAGQLGLGDTVSRYVPTQVGTGTDWKAVATGNTSGYALKQDGSLWAWGGNASGQLGLGDRTQRLVPTRVGSATSWTRVAGGGPDAFAIRGDHSLWGWGKNNL
ncbi:MAG TPA: chromosome condensation regulator RCC1, partial [Thermoleophilia bacterium]|nr:chromosome condensation regulator RCC1 [Thermoleophilia bacterium]